MMSVHDTKQKILNASLLLFNEYGISNVRLQQIANETGISVGNLAYHFNNKEAITESLITNVIISLRDLLKQCGQYDTFRDLDFFFKEFYQLSAQHRFFNFDVLEVKRNFPSLYELLQPLFYKIKVQLEKRFDMCIQQRLIHKDSNIKNIAANIWLLLFFMPLEGQVNGKYSAITESQYRRRLWDYVSPYFTPKGSGEFESDIEPGLTGK